MLQAFFSTSIAHINDYRKIMSFVFMLMYVAILSLSVIFFFGTKQPDYFLLLNYFSTPAIGNNNTPL